MLRLTTALLLLGRRLPQSRLRGAGLPELPLCKRRSHGAGGDFCLICDPDPPRPVGLFNLEI
jgi:hypothetical protein